MQHKAMTTSTGMDKKKAAIAPSQCGRCSGQVAMSQFRDHLGEPFRFVIFCPMCDETGPERESLAAAIEAWNEWNKVQP